MMSVVLIKNKLINYMGLHQCSAKYAPTCDKALTNYIKEIWVYVYSTFKS